MTLTTPRGRSAADRVQSWTLGFEMSTMVGFLTSLSLPLGRIQGPLALPPQVVHKVA
jgi:hypothetical protein